MKTRLPKPTQPLRFQHSRGGMAMIVVIAILAVILLFVAGNLRALHSLKSEINLVEKRHARRLAALQPVTNAQPQTVTNSNANLAPPASQP